MIKIIIAHALILASVSTLAGPPQMDVLGLVPGISEADDVRKAGVDPAGTSDVFVKLSIGGHQIPCVISYIDRKLASLGCVIGRGSKPSERYTEASNIMVYLDLLTGFSKKFGKPDSVSKTPVRTGLGVEHEINVATWIDKKGNKLQLVSMLGVATQGMMTFESAEYLRRQAAESEAAQSGKKF